MLIYISEPFDTLIFGVIEDGDYYRQTLVGETPDGLAVLETVPEYAGYYSGTFYERTDVILEAPGMSAEITVTIYPYLVDEASADGVVSPIVTDADVTGIECEAIVMNFWVDDVDPEPLEVEAFAPVTDVQVITLKCNATGTGNLRCVTASNRVLIRKTGTSTWVKTEDFEEVVSGGTYYVDVKWLKGNAGLTKEDLEFRLEIAGGGA